MIKMSLVAARQFRDRDECALRAAKAALAEEYALHGSYVSEATEAVEIAKKKFEFSARRVTQIMEDEIFAEMAAVAARREARIAAEAEIAAMPKTAPKSRKPRAKKVAVVA